MDTATLTTEGGRKVRLNRKLQDAIKYIVLEGRSQKDAADLAGMTQHGLSNALKKPHVKAYRARVLEARINNYGELAIKTLADIMQDPKAPAGVRRGCAHDLMDLAGYDRNPNDNGAASLTEKDTPNTLVINIATNPERPEPDSRGVIDLHALEAEDADYTEVASPPVTEEQAETPANTGD